MNFKNLSCLSLAVLLILGCSGDKSPTAIFSANAFKPGVEKNYAVYKDDGKFGYLDMQTGKVAITAQFEWASTFSEGRAAFGVKCNPKRFNRCQKYGFIDNTGKPVIEPQFIRKPGSFRNNRACVFSKGLYGFIDRDGKNVIEPQFTYCTQFADGLAPVYVNGEARDLKLLWLPPSGNKVRAGHINTDGALVGAPKYNTVFPLSEGVAAVCMEPSSAGNKKCGWVDAQGKEVLPPKYASLYLRKGGKTVFALAGRYGFLNDKGKIDVEAKYNDLSPLSDGLAIAKKGEKFGAVDENGKWVIKPRYHSIGNFRDGLAHYQLTEGGSYGYLDRKGSVVVEPKFKYASSFVNGVASVTVSAGSGTKSKDGLIGKDGKYILTPTYDDISMPAIQATKPSELADAPKDVTAATTANLGKLTSVGLSAPEPIKPVDAAKVYTHTLAGACLFYSKFGGTPDAISDQSRDKVLGYLKKNIPEYAMAIQLEGELPEEQTKFVGNKAWDICKGSTEIESGSLYTSVDALKANYGSLKGSWASTFVLGSATPDSYYNCDFDDRSTYRSFDIRGIDGGSAINGYCKSWDDDCKLLQQATSSGKGTLGLFGVRYPRNNSICSDRQAHLVSVGSIVGIYNDLAPRIRAEVEKVLTSYQATQ